MSSDSAAVAQDRLLFGWRVRTDIALPECAPWTGDARPPDLRITIGAVPPLLTDAEHLSPLLQVNSNREARLVIDGVATFWLRSECEIVIDPQIHADRPDVRTFLYGTILGLLCHSRGLFPLHASCVVVDRRTIAVSGASGAGKSTLAAALVRRGHRMVADDICAIDPFATGGPMVRPAFPRVKLWQDSLNAINVAAQGLEANRFGQQKYNLRFGDVAQFQADPLPLNSIYLLEPAAAPIMGRADIERLALVRAATGVHEHIYRRRTALHWGGAAELFKMVGHIVGTVPVHRLTRGHDLATLDDLVRRLEGHATQ